MNILVTGGAGFIGSHTIIELYKAGHTAVVVDNLSNSNPESLRRVSKILGGTEIPFFKVDMAIRSVRLSDRDGTNPKCPAAGIYVMVYPSDARIFNALAKFSSFTRI